MQDISAWNFANDVLENFSTGRTCSQIEDYVNRCSTCLEHRSSVPKEPMMSPAIPNGPWKLLATYLFECHNGNYLIVADYYSHYFEISLLPNITVNSVINHMKSIFARHGICEELISDNGSQYTSAEFKRFVAEWSFKHTMNSPYHHQSNGLAEKYVDIAKRIMKKAQTDGTDPYMGLLVYRNTPTDGTATPAQLLMSRRLRDNLPVQQKRLRPSVQNVKDVQRRLSQKRMNSEKYYNRNTQSQKPLKEGEDVYMQQLNGKWKPAIVRKVAEIAR
ncbi:uncharacterized protein K02A2.6-like [Liolophura sinensis]|uniref:uncharacterized protein K02A2.6-like n=1 Tax=Liolophura sinensis TaxID=3198878 RepID=UPI003158B531